MYFHKKGFAHLILLASAGILLPLILIAIFLPYTNYKYITPPPRVQKALDSLLALTPLPKNTRLILEKTNVSDIDSANLENNLNVAINGQNYPLKGVKISSSGNINQKDQNNSKLDQKIAAEINLEGVTLFAKTQIIKIDGKTYFNISELPSIAKDLEKYKNQWYFLEDNGQNSITFSNAKNIFQSFIENGDNWKKIGEDKTTYTLQSKPSGLAIQSLAYEFLDSLNPKSTSFEKNQEQQRAKTFTNKINSFAITLAVNKANYAPSELKVDFELQTELPEISNNGKISFGNDENDKISVSFDSKIKPSTNTQITTPENAKNFKDLKEEINKLMPSGQTSLSPNGQVAQNNFESFVLGQKNINLLQFFNDFKESFGI